MTWAKVQGGFHDPERFAHVVLSGTPEMIGKLSAEFRKGGRTGPITVLIRAAPRMSGDYRATGDISIDGALVGRISSAELAESLTLRLLDPGVHRYRVRLQLLSLEGMMQFTPAGSVVGEGTISLRNGDVLSAWWSPGGEAELVAEQ
jgi:hypothetical protein